VALLFGADATVEVAEGGVRFPVDPLGGQKTGWYFDQRPNRDRVAALAKDARVLDVFCHVGAFGLRCAFAGASDVTLVDSSASTLAQAEMAAALNGVADRMHIRRDDAFEALPASGSTSWCAIHRRSPGRARMRTRACVPTDGWRAWPRLWLHRVGSCSSRRAVTTHRWRPGVRRSPSVCIARGARDASYSAAAPARTTRCIRTYRSQRI
jgi:hypothetical protein